MTGRIQPKGLLAANTTIMAAQTQMAHAGDWRLREALANGLDIRGVFAFTPVTAALAHAYNKGP